MFQVNSTYARISSTDIVYVNGRTENPDQQANFFIYDTETDMFAQERSDKQLLEFGQDRQGNKDYRDIDVFYQLSDRSVKVLDKKTFDWQILDIAMVKIEKTTGFQKLSNLGCLSK